MTFIILLLISLFFGFLAYDKSQWLKCGWRQKVDFGIYSLLFIFFLWWSADVLWKG